MQHDQLLRAIARDIFEVCYPDDWSPVGYEEAERLGTIHYRQAVEAAQRVRSLTAAKGEQLPLFEAA